MVMPINLLLESIMGIRKGTLMHALMGISINRLIGKSMVILMGELTSLPVGVSIVSSTCGPIVSSKDAPIGVSTN